MGYDLYREGADNTRDGDGYYRLNIWGMSEATEALADIGIVRWADSPPVPMAADYGIEDADWDTDEDDTLSVDQVAYRTAIELWRDGTQEAPGIPSYKFGSNDGWLVTPLEIRSGIVVADTNSAGWRNSLPDWVLEFVTWMEQGAAQEVSFRVW